MGEPQMGLQARLMSQALRKLTANIKRTNTLVIFINQIRMKIGVMFGNPETTTGGNALKFYASVRIDIRRIGSIKKGDEVIGSETRVKIVKNKVAPPFRQAEFDILYGEGISREGEILEIGVLHGVLEKSGAWYIYNGDRLGQGKDNARDFLKENPALAQEIEGKIREKVGVQKAGAGRRGRRRSGEQQSREAADPQTGITAWRPGTASASAMKPRRCGFKKCFPRCSPHPASRRPWRCFRGTTGRRRRPWRTFRRALPGSQPCSTRRRATSRRATASDSWSGRRAAGKSSSPNGSVEPPSVDTPQELKARALRYLVRREHSRDELSRKLAPHAESQQILEGTLNWLESTNKLSNQRFAEVRAHVLARKYGAAKIRQDLKAKGIDDYPVSAADEVERARAILARKYRIPPTTREERAKRARFLQGRGFSATSSTA